MAIHVINEAERCLQCKKPMCQEGCPIHTPIPQMIKYFKEERLEEAGGYALCQQSAVHCLLSGVQP